MPKKSRCRKCGDQVQAPQLVGSVMMVTPKGHPNKKPRAVAVTKRYEPKTKRASGSGTSQTDSPPEQQPEPNETPDSHTSSS